MSAKRFLLYSLSALFLISCSQQKEQAGISGFLSFNIEHTVNGLPLKVDEFAYTNEAGNQYMITEIQWFISGISLIDDQGNRFNLPEEESVFYIDTDIESSLQINLNAKIPAGNYSGISFVFGLDEEQNKSLRFVNPPESFMFWPEYLGGGYHYMKLNGKWINEAGLPEPFNFHLGIGQEYEDGYAKSTKHHFGAATQYDHCEGYQPSHSLPAVVSFIDNSFNITLNDVVFTVANGKRTSLKLEMQIENWFQTPHVYDHNEWGGSIMQQQDAMRLGCENGNNVFVIKPVE